MKPLQGLRILSLEVWARGRTVRSCWPRSRGSREDRNPGTGGDPARNVGPHLLGEGDSQYFQAWNTSTEERGLDLKSAKAGAISRSFVTIFRSCHQQSRGDQPPSSGSHTQSSARSIRPSCVAHLGLRPRQRAPACRATTS